MSLKRIPFGLLFFFFWGTLFSQLEELKIGDDTDIAYAFADDTDGYFVDYNKVVDIEDKYASLLDSLTCSEKKSKAFTINVLNINSKYSDYAPVFFEDELVFASSRNVNSISKSFDEISNEPFLDLYTATKRSNKDRISKLKGSVNTKFHESSVAFTKDKKTMYFTRNNYSKKRSRIRGKEIVLLKIYKATNIDGKWKNVEELPFNGDDYSVAHPTLSPDGRFLYFASDMPGSFGKSDLYVVEIYDDGSYGNPINLGDKINTPERETFPFISDNGNLFFASNGHEGAGGLDIFMSLPDRDGVFGAYNLGTPINSPEDDFTFIINEKHKVGYFASNRKGGKGGDDIYGFKQLAAFPKVLNRKPLQKLERIINIKPIHEVTTLD